MGDAAGGEGRAQVELVSLQKLDSQAWASFLDDWGPRAHAVCRRLLSSFSVPSIDAGDCVQEAALRLVERIDDITSVQHAGKWLVTTARNYCWDEVRRARREEPLEEGPAARLGVSDRALSDGDPGGILALANEDERLMLYCAYYLCMTSREIASVLEKSPEAVRVALSRFRKRVRERRERGEEPVPGETGSAHTK